VPQARPRPGRRLPGQPGWGVRPCDDPPPLPVTAPTVRRSTTVTRAHYGRGVHGLRHDRAIECLAAGLAHLPPSPAPGRRRLVAVGRGVSSTHAAQRARVAAGRDPLAGESAGALSAADRRLAWPRSMRTREARILRHPRNQRLRKSTSDSTNLSASFSSLLPMPQPHQAGCKTND
jgi:hypothetical protein